MECRCPWASLPAPRPPAPPPPAAAGLSGRRHYSRAYKDRLNGVMPSAPATHVTYSGSPITSATSREGVPSVASTATEPAMSLTRSPVTSSKSRLVGASILQCAIRPSFPLAYDDLNDISHLSEVKTYREWKSG